MFEGSAVPVLSSRAEGVGGHRRGRSMFDEPASVIAAPSPVAAVSVNAIRNQLKGGLGLNGWTRDRLESVAPRAIESLTTKGLMTSVAKGAASVSGFPATALQNGLREIFRMQHGLENFDFLMTAAQFKFKPNADWARSIFKEYCAADAPKNVNISSGQLQNLKVQIAQVHTLTAGQLKDVFDQSQSEIYKMVDQQNIQGAKNIALLKEILSSLVKEELAGRKL